MTTDQQLLLALSEHVVNLARGQEEIANTLKAMANRITSGDRSILSLTDKIIERVNAQGTQITVLHAEVKAWKSEDPS